MEKLFMTVLEMGLRGSAVIGAVLLARLPLRKAPAAARLALWALVAVALLVPVRFKTELSLMPAPAAQQSEAAVQTAPTDREVARLQQALILEGERTYVMTAPAQETPGTVTAKQAVSWVWAGGTLLMLLWAVGSWARLRLRLRAAVRLRENIYLCDHIPSPFVLGLFRPRIYLPSDLPEGSRGPVLAHERGHIFRGDHLTRLLGWGILSVYWWDPLVWIAYILFCRDTEMACDEWVIRGLEKQEVREYSEALIACSLPRKGLGLYLAFGEVGIGTRIKNILRYKKPGVWICLAAVILAAAVAVCFLTERPPEEAVVPETEPQASQTGAYAETPEQPSTDTAPTDPGAAPPLELTGALSPEGARALADFRDGTGYQFFSDEAAELVRLLNALTAEDFVYEPQTAPAFSVTLTASGRDVYLESDTDLVVLVHDGIRWGIRDGELSELFRSVYAATNYEGYDVAPLEELRDHYSMEEAAVDRCVIQCDGILWDNEEVWEEFYGACQVGRSATVRIWEKTDGVTCVRDLSFDGSSYTLQWYEDDRLCTETWSFLRRFTGDWSGNAQEDSGRDRYHYDRYILTDDPEGSWDEGSHSLQRSDCRAVCSSCFYYPQHPALPGGLQKAELVLDGKVILATVVPESLARLEIFFRDAEETYEPKTYNLGPELVLWFPEETVRVQMDLNKDLCVIGGVFYDYGPGYDDDGSYNALPELLACFSIRSWPQQVVDRYGDYIWS